LLSFSRRVHSGCRVSRPGPSTMARRCVHPHTRRDGRPRIAIPVMSLLPVCGPPSCCGIRFSFVAHVEDRILPILLQIRSCNTPDKLVKWCGRANPLTGCAVLCRLTNCMTVTRLEVRRAQATISFSSRSHRCSHAKDLLPPHTTLPPLSTCGPHLLTSQNRLHNLRGDVQLIRQHQAAIALWCSVHQLAIWTTDDDC
jgi:hypothetical protein